VLAILNFKIIVSILFRLLSVGKPQPLKGGKGAKQASTIQDDSSFSRQSGLRLMYCPCICHLCKRFPSHRPNGERSRGCSPSHWPNGERSRGCSPSHWPNGERSRGCSPSHWPNHLGARNSSSQIPNLYNAFSLHRKSLLSIKN
jgi:hypothetical protein